MDADFSFSFSHAEFTDDAPEGREIPGAIESTIAVGATVELPSGIFGSARLRYFGSRPLIEDDGVRSDSTTLVNLRAGYKYKDLTVALDVLNLLDSEDHDIDYFFTSRLAGEPADGVDDIHFHPVEPRTIRGTIRLQF